MLQEYVDQMNRWNAIFDRSAMTFPLSQSNANDLMNKIAGELSPENLHCDGEISARQAQAKYNNYMRVLKELRAYADKAGMTVPQMWEA